jgi:hypothetical protein
MTGCPSPLSPSIWNEHESGADGQPAVCQSSSVYTTPSFNATIVEIDIFSTVPAYSSSFRAPTIVVGCFHSVSPPALAVGPDKLK